MAMRVWNRRHAGPYCDFLSPLDSRKSALVDDSWSQSRGGTDCRRGRTKDYGITRGRGGGQRLQRSPAHPRSNTHAYAVARNLGRDRTRTSPAFIARFRADADTGFFLQRDLLHLCTGPYAVLQGARAKCGRLSLAIRVGKCARSSVARALVRHNWPEQTESCHLWFGRHSPRANRLAFSRGTADRTNANARLDGNLFHRLGRSELSLLDRKRDFSVGNSSGSNRNFLRDRNIGRRGRRAAPIRLDHWHRIDDGIVPGISAGSGANDFRRGH